MSEPIGCSIEPLDDHACHLLIRELLGNAPVAVSASHSWVLAHCDDGVVWGLRSKDGWALSSGSFKELVAAITHSNVQQLRLFGSSSEILIWRSGANGADGVYRGRILRDVAFDTERAPFEESVVLVGDRLLHPQTSLEERNRENPFSLVGDATGSCHAVPLSCEERHFRENRWPLRLDIKHYLEEDKDTGALRIAASRLVRLHNEEARS